MEGEEGVDDAYDTDPRPTADLCRVHGHMSHVGQFFGDYARRRHAVSGGSRLNLSTHDSQEFANLTAMGTAQCP